MNSQIFGLILIAYLIGSTLLAAFLFRKYVNNKYGRGSFKRSLVGIASITATSYYLYGLLYSDVLLTYLQFLSPVEQTIFNYLWTVLIVATPHYIFYTFIKNRKGFRFFFGYHENDEEFLLEEQLNADHSELLDTLDSSKKSSLHHEGNEPNKQ